ncbi:MAG: hypothetical protein HN673_08655 [Rhodospirillales bacterium]|jgi:hypothetical protein|nr:hypothetical protein [Rhodospirillales bacterium]
MSDEDEETLEAIALDSMPVEVKEAAVPVQLNQLQPWHRPRKQMVRKNQWLRLADRLINNLLGTPGLRGVAGKWPELRYLTLPGIDFFDVRLLAENCYRNECQLTSTGFLAANEESPIRARAEVRQAALVASGHITQESATLWRNFEEISSTAGQAYKEICQRGPFQIVNVDACGSIALPSHDHANRMIDALHRLIEFQIDKLSSHWLLFITTDVRPENLSDNTLSAITEAIRVNAANNVEFSARTQDYFGKYIEDGPNDIDTIIETTSQKEGRPFVDIFSTGLGKWILHLAKEKNWDMKMHHSYCYSTRREHRDGPTMPCLAFEFIPPPPGLQDHFAASRAEPAPGGVNVDTSVRVIEMIAGMVDLDELMNEDAELRQQLLTSTRNLMDEANYSQATMDSLADFDNSPMP